MGHPRVGTSEVVRRGTEIYESRLRALLDNQDNSGKRLIIDVETGDYEMDADILTASDRAHARHPDGAFFGMRIGYRASGTI